MIQKLSDCGAGARIIANNEINKALREHGVSLRGAVAAEVNAHANVLWGPSDIVVRVLHEDARLQTLDEYLSELKHDPKYTREFPSSQKRQISRHDMAGLSANQEKIARGEIAVVDECEE